MALLLSILATGCLTGGIKVKVNKDGSGTADIEIFPTDELQKLLTAANAIPLAKGAVNEVSDSSFESFTKDGRVGYKAHLPFDDYQELGRVLTEGAVIGKTHVRLFSNFELTEIDGRWKLNALLAPEMLSEALRAQATTEQLIDTEGLQPLNSDLRLTIALPGRITRTNGTQVASGSAEWALKSNREATLVIMTEPKPLLTPVQKVFAGAGLAIVVGVFLLVWGSQHSWGSGTERRERRRAKKLRFAGSAGARNDGWQGTGPMASVPEGTVPRSGPMPPRAIPTLGSSTGGWGQSAPGVPPFGEPPLVAAPVAPAVSPTAPNPWAPHRPGAPLPTSSVLAETDRHAAVYGASPMEGEAVQTAPPPPVAPVAPVAFEPPPVAPVAPVAFEPAPAAPVAEPAGAPLVPPQVQVAEQATAHHDAFYHDPSNELVGLEHKVEAAGLHDPDPLSPKEAAPHDLLSEGGAGEAGEDGSEAVPWWFETEEGGADVDMGDGPAPASASAPIAEPAVHVDTEAPAKSLFSTEASTETAAQSGTAVSEEFTGADAEGHHFVSTGAGFFDYSPGDQAVEAEPEVQEMATPEEEPLGYEPVVETGPAWAPSETGDSTLSGEAPGGEALGGEAESTSGPTAAMVADFEADYGGEYPSIDGSGGLDLEDLTAPPAEPVPVEYPSIDGGGGLEESLGGERQIPPDWYPDPDDPNRFRWWDGADWTDFVSESGS